MTEITDRLDKLIDIQHELESILQTLILNDSTIIDALAQILGAVQQMQTRAEQSQREVAEAIRTFAAELQSADGRQARIAPQTVISTGDFAAENPEIALLEHLYSFLANTDAIDVGANVGRVSEGLLHAGYKVVAFEPYPPAFGKLQDRLGGNGNFRAYQLAIGSSDGRMDLHVAADLSEKKTWDPTLFNSVVHHPMLKDVDFTSTIPIEVRSLESLRRTGEIPDSAGILKIDTEGCDLDVVRGMGSARFSVVMAEFWDGEHPFGVAGHGKLEDLVREMRARGYSRHIVIYHVDETETISFYANRTETVPKSWGNAIFFQDHALFLEALNWCRAVLAPTVYR